ncbi:MAG: hypothetical protein AAF597_12930 [Bacteroidota bacterium]
MSRAQYAQAQREARRAEQERRWDEIAVRKEAALERREARLAELAALREARRVDKMALASQKAANRMALQAQRQQRKETLLAAREAKKADLLALRAEKLATRKALKADRIAQREARKGERIAAAEARKADRLARKADRMANQEARRAARIAARDARKADRLARKADRMAARAARRADRRAAGWARRVAPRLARLERRKNRIPPYWTAEPALALSLPLKSGGNGDEKALEGISFQALVGHHRAKGLSIRSGLVYATINSKVSGERTETTTVTQRAVVAIIQNPDGSQTEQMGNVEVPQTTVTKTQFFNSVTSLDIPLLIGYRIPNSKYNLMIEAGPSLNLSSGGSAHLKNGTSFAQVGGGHFLGRRMGMGFLANLSGEYPLNDQAAITGTLRIQSFGGGFENPAAAAQTNYSLIGIQVGYRFKF